MQIERATISLPAAAAIIMATFGVGGAATYFEARLSAAEKKAAAVETQGRKLDKLAMVICLDSAERIARCRQTGLLE
jgi:hypothetical protein